jgi:phosphonate transport system ATP-binding protein
LSLSIQSGERVALAGPSGSGKTTLLYLLAGIVQPDEGRIFIDGRRLSALRPGGELARLVGVMHQQYDLVPHLPVVHNVLAGRLGQWGLFRSILSLIRPQERHLAEAALAQLGIADKLNERTAHLSGGEQQRVAIARLMVQSSRIILADEPVSSLDPARADDMLRLLTGQVATTGKTLVVSLHSPYLLRKYFSRVIGLREGSLEFDMPATEMKEVTLERLYDLDRRGPQEASPGAP